jgi:arsenate reductase-like glutaredoxin family protein
LTPDEQSKASLKAGAFDLMQHKTSVIKRPLVEWPDGSVTVGFDEKLFSDSI